MQRLGKYISATIEKLLRNGVFCGGRPEDLRQLRIELRESLEMAVEDDEEEKFSTRSVPR
jgi:hypothetical protein